MSAAPIGTDGNRVNWTMPTPHRLDELPEGVCQTCAGIRFVWLTKKYLCRTCKGTGLATPEQMFGEEKDAA